MTSPNWNPEWIWAIAIIVLAIVIVYATMRTSRRSRQEQRRSDVATERLYREEDRRNSRAGTLAAISALHAQETSR